MKKVLIIALAVLLLAGCGKDVRIPQKNGGTPEIDQKTSSEQFVSEENVKKMIFTLVEGATEKDIREFKKELDDGRWKYEVKVIFNKMEYEFEIDAKTGQVINFDSESVFD